MATVDIEKKTDSAELSSPRVVLDAFCIESLNNGLESGIEFLFTLDRVLSHVEAINSGSA